MCTKEADFENARDNITSICREDHTLRRDDATEVGVEADRRRNIEESEYGWFRGQECKR